MRVIKLKETGTSQTIDVTDYEVHIEANPDTWRGGYVWSVCLGDVELVSGLEYSRKFAKDFARRQMICTIYKSDLGIATRDL